MAAFDEAMLYLVETHSESGRHPVTVRQAYYVATTMGFVGKTDTGYRKVVRHLASLRENGRLPWAWIADNARIRRQMDTYSTMSDALDEMQWSYRRDYWRSQPYRVEVWVESDAIASALSHTVLPYGVPLFTCRGQASKSYIWQAAADAAALGKPIRIIYLGDFDPTGLAIDLSLEERYRRYSDRAALEVERVAVTVEHVRRGLPSGPAKVGDSNYKRFAAYCEAQRVPVASVEAEALPPAELRDLAKAAVEAWIDAEVWESARQYEAEERRQLRQLVGGWTGSGDGEGWTR
jgi:hypothetical protein